MGVLNTFMYLFFPVGIMVFVGASILRVLRKRVKVQGHLGNEPTMVSINKEDVSRDSCEL